MDATRRAFLRFSATAAMSAGGVAVMAIPSGAAAPEGESIIEIRHLIEAHRSAEAAFEDYIRQEEAEVARIGREGYEAREWALGDAGTDALGELMDYPMTTFEEVMVKVAYFRTIRNFLDQLASFEDQDGAFFDAFPETGGLV